VTTREKVAAQIARFDQLTLRERALVGLVALAAVLLAWDSLVLRPLSIRERAAHTALETITQGGGDSELATSLQSATVRYGELVERERELQRREAELDSKLGNAGAGMVEPKHMVEVIREVLSRQSGLTLVSLKNLQVRPLAAAEEGQEPTGPFIHPVEVVVEGDYFSVLSYLRELEGLEWRLHWHAMQLESGTYPVNRVRIELSTLGMERAWLGV